MSALLSLLVLFGIGYLVWRWLSRRPEPLGEPTSHGTAKFADGADLSRMGFLGGRGFPLGWWSGYLATGTETGQQRTAHALTYSGDRHRLIASPTRGGKFVSCAAPLLLSDVDSSAVVIDIKGECAAVTGAWRATAGPIHVLDAWGISGHESACFNPLDLLTPDSSDLAEDAAMIADALFITPRSESSGNAMFFIEEGKALLAAIILYVACHPDEADKRHLLRVREIITTKKTDLAKIIYKMMDSKDIAHGLAARGAARFEAKDPREASGVLSTVQQNTHFLDSPRLGEILKRSTFGFSDLKKQLCTIYLVLPAERLTTYNRWLRTLISISITSLTRTPGKPLEPIKYIVDEMPALGPLDSLRTGVSLLSGFGVQFHLIIQDFSQLKSIYGEGGFESFVANCGILQVFGVRDLFTARYISDMLGMSTVRVITHQSSRSSSGGPGGATRGSSSSETMAEVGRPLLTAGEVMTLDDHVQLIFPASGPPIICAKHRWYFESPWRERGQAAPDIFKPLGALPSRPIVVHGGGRDYEVGLPGAPSPEPVPATPGSVPPPAAASPPPAPS